MRPIFFAIVATLLCSSCRRVPGADDLKWSCATVQRSGPAIATPECYDELQRIQNPVLLYYTALPQTSVEGKIDRYFLVENDTYEPALGVAQKGQ